MEGKNIRLKINLRGCQGMFGAMPGYEGNGFITQAGYLYSNVSVGRRNG